MKAYRTPKTAQTNMARTKKPVDRTPICDPAYLRRIDPLWMPGPVPSSILGGRDASPRLPAVVCKQSRPPHHGGFLSARTRRATDGTTVAD